MSATEHERRMVAERLRSMSLLKGTSTPGDAGFVRDINEVVDKNNSALDYDTIKRKLADLIDPEQERTCELEIIYTGGASSSAYICSCKSCGWQGDVWDVCGLTEDGIDYMMKKATPKYCPGCGARVTCRRQMPNA